MARLEDVNKKRTREFAIGSAKLLESCAGSGKFYLHLEQQLMTSAMNVATLYRGATLATSSAAYNVKLTHILEELNSAAMCLELLKSEFSFGLNSQIDALLAESTGLISFFAASRR